MITNVNTNTSGIFLQTVLYQNLGGIAGEDDDGDMTVDKCISSHIWGGSSDLLLSKCSFGCTGYKWFY